MSTSFARGACNLHMGGPVIDLDPSFLQLSFLVFLLSVSFLTVLSFHSLFDALLDSFMSSIPGWTEVERTMPSHKTHRHYKNLCKQVFLSS